jgi:hypothetical protein
METQNEKKETKMGRPPKLQDPTTLKKLVDSYFQYCDDNPYIINVPVTGGNNAGMLIPVPKPRPYIIEGLCLHLGISRITFYNILAKNTQQSENDEEIFNIFTYASDKIRSQQITGGMCNDYNSSLTARINGLKEQTDITSNDETITSINIQFTQDTSD